MRKAASGCDYARKLRIKGSSVAQQLRRCYTIPVVVHGDYFAFAAMESELRKMRSRMCDWCDVGARAVLGSGKREVRVVDTLERSLRWTEALATVNSAAVKPEEIGQEEGANMLDEAERQKFRSLAATLSYMSLDRSDVQYAAKENMHEDVDSDTRELEETERRQPDLRKEWKEWA